jgi:hypothetical protein
VGPACQRAVKKRWAIFSTAPNRVRTRDLTEDGTERNQRGSLTDLVRSSAPTLLEQKLRGVHLDTHDGGRPRWRAGAPVTLTGRRCYGSSAEGEAVKVRVLQVDKGGVLRRLHARHELVATVSVRCGGELGVYGVQRRATEREGTT